MEHNCKFFIFKLLIFNFFFINNKTKTKKPVSIKDWEIHFQFKVTGHGKDLFGDGLAMWYVQDRNELGKI